MEYIHKATGTKVIVIGECTILREDNQEKGITYKQPNSERLYVREEKYFQANYEPRESNNNQTFTSIESL